MSLWMLIPSVSTSPCTILVAREGLLSKHAQFTFGLLS